MTFINLNLSTPNPAPVFLNGGVSFVFFQWVKVESFCTVCSSW